MRCKPDPDMTFLMRRRAADPKTGWSHFNQMANERDAQNTTVSHMLIVLRPGHEYKSMNTVVKRCQHIFEKIGPKTCFNSR